MMNRSRVQLAAFIALLLYGLFFVALSFDIMVRVWNWRGRFDTPLDVLVLLYFECVRSVVTLAGLVTACVAAARTRRHPATQHLAYAIVLGTIAYSKAIAFDGFPGAGQEALALALRARDVPQWLLSVIFGHAEWALWLMLAPLLLFAASYPRRITAADVTTSGTDDRQGSMRSVALAGTDVGQLSREVTARALESRWLRPRAVWLLAACAAVLHTGALVVSGAGGDRLITAVAVLVLAATAALWIPLFRAAARAATAEERRPLDWLRRAGVAALALVAASAAAGALLPGSLISVAAFSLAPVAAAGCVAVAVLLTPYGVGLPPNTFSTSPVM